MRFEARGVASVGIATEPFADEAIEQARQLGMPAVRVLYVPHPVQLLATETLHAYADALFGDVAAALTGPAPAR